VSEITLQIDNGRFSTILQSNEWLLYSLQLKHARGECDTALM